MKNFADIGLQVPQIYLPKPGTDFSRWAVIACDQFTSQPDYWQKVESTVGEAPSTLRLTLPEIYLEQTDVPDRIRDIHTNMKHYLDKGVLQPADGMIYVERTTGGRTRRGIIAALDLERYDYRQGSTSLIRATEGTIVDRLPPRIRIRENAPLELPHILVLIDDPDNLVIGPIFEHKVELEKVYDFDLMLGSGHLAGYRINRPTLEANLISSLRSLVQPRVLAEKYGLAPSTPPLLYAMGDGNHSLATAKAIWERSKSVVGMDHPYRYALVEIENVHDDALTFEPIHRVLFDVKRDFVAYLKSALGGNIQSTPTASPEVMVKLVDSITDGRQVVGLVEGGKYSVLEFTAPKSNLAVGTLQPALDQYLAGQGAAKVDYVHGADVTMNLGNQPGNLGIYLPAMKKTELFKTVIVDGALPRKTFSLGEAHEKRFYMEARKII